MRGDEFFQAIAKRPPFTKLHPRVAAFFKDYLSKEKVISFNGRSVINTHFPPFPSPAFDQLARQFAELGNAATRRLYSVTLAVTNRCSFNCWHCYNAGRSQVDMPLNTLLSLAGQLQDLGAVMVTITGGEPLLRDDLAEILHGFGPSSCLVLGTTGDGLTSERARTLRENGLFAVGISLDSDREPEHDRLRGRTGAFRTALEALTTARANGLYPYVVSVATREFLQRSRFIPFLRFAAQAGALEVHLLEPCATGKLAGHPEVLLSAVERQQVLSYQAEVARDESLPILSSFSYLESAQNFGCGAGLTHIYIDGSGEVCPCNLVPLSFGNLCRESFGGILDRMGQHFRRPRESCVGRLLVKHYPAARLPAPAEESAGICKRHLPAAHGLPAFFRIRDECRGEEVGACELRAAYDDVHQSYDAFWLTSAAAPTQELIASLQWTGKESVFEAGCGTGYATALLARRCGQVLAVDISEQMQAQARARLIGQGIGNVQFQTGDALAALRDVVAADLVAADLKRRAPNPSPAPPQHFDIIFSSWVLGYIPLTPFFEAASNALNPAGRLAFVVHRENSPREPMEIFSELVAEDPTLLLKRVAFDFPRDGEHVQSLLHEVGFQVERLQEGSIVFEYPTAEQVLEHLLKSGAGTAFYDAIDPGRRSALTDRFLNRLSRGHEAGSSFQVRHEYVSCVAVKRSS